jgi:CheY-like chemotaxis protein
MSEQRKRRVLIIDDDVDFQAANRLALEASGFEVLSATDSRRGVEMAEHEHPDLIIMDLMMEQLYAGFSAVQALCAHEATRGIPIIMVSGVTTETGFRIDQGHRKPEWLQVVEFVNKPIDPVELARKIASTLDEHK